ncbi:DUF500-domain-containing protein [Tilletiaria anomala UBC 951]|uniref:DUF500-domain-containing protein n=1 Tax=Tilletiaria anomala (strain ATCC 24038 / CBS 436.72 / UBC 951) TaxID=1037660 RepID=A0A066VX75_TILAU|nr:DUF500-domain-containing protein [Tilletiaria anomala UBC 951]KDN46101.1 DUF500-domain-containing protein [Tilletiaria anomala UBC 951]
MKVIEKLKKGAKKAETASWRGLAPVGNWANKQSRRVGGSEFWPVGLDKECEKAGNILRSFALDSASMILPEGGKKSSSDDASATNKRKQKNERATRQVPAAVLHQARGVAIFTVFRTGFGFSGAGGSGVVVSRLPNGSWSGPSGLLIHTAGVGYTIGLDVYDVVLVLRTEDAVKAFAHPRVSVGADFAITAGPIGSAAQLDVGVTDKSKPVFSYVKSKGMYAGVAIEGTIILKRDDENRRFYNADVSATQILSGDGRTFPPPTGARPLLATLYSAEGKIEVMGTTDIPSGKTTDDLRDFDEDQKLLTANTSVARGSVATDVPIGGVLNSEGKRRLPPMPAALDAEAAIAASSSTARAAPFVPSIGPPQSADEALALPPSYT